MPSFEYTNALESYWGPAQVRLYIEGVWIDDACAVNYRVQDVKIPKE